jgi:hypothetical protein
VAALAPQAHQDDPQACSSHLSYVLSLPDEPDDAAALRRSEAQGDVNDLALDAIEILKGTKKAVAKKQLQRKTGYGVRRFLGLHKYLRSLIVAGEEDGTPDELVTSIEPEPATGKTVDVFKVWSPAVIKSAIGTANDLDNGNGVLNLRANDKLLSLAVPWTLRYERWANGREVMKASGHFVSVLAEGSVYRLGTDDAYAYDASDRNGYRRAIAGALKSCGARCGKAKVPRRR